MNAVKKMDIAFRFMQIAVALIPVVIGFLALLNNITGFSDTETGVIVPLITMKDHTSQLWRSVPSSFAGPVYIIMFIGEFLVGVIALVGVILMTKISFALKFLSLQNVGYTLPVVRGYLSEGWDFLKWVVIGS